MRNGLLNTEKDDLDTGTLEQVLESEGTPPPPTPRAYQHNASFQMDE